MDRQVKDGLLSVVQAQGSVAEWTSTRGYEALGRSFKDSRERERKAESRDSQRKERKKVEDANYN